MKDYSEISQKSLPFQNPVREEDFLHLYIDGASRGNPGEAGVGIVIKESSNKTIAEVSKYIGITTNNRAEYTALIEGLKAVTRLKKRSQATVHGLRRAQSSGTRLRVFTDSELLVKQLKGQYKVRDRNIKNLYHKVSVLLNDLEDVEIKHISRENNKEADKLANKAIDENNRGRLDDRSTFK